MYDPEDNPFDTEAQDQAASSFRAPAVDISPNAETVEEILHGTKDLLDAEISREQSRVDAEPDFLFERVILHPKGNVLPQFSAAEELRDGRSGSDLMIPVQKMGMTYDKNMMERIRAGQGPRPFKQEDLVEVLRVEPRCLPDVDEFQHTEESYDELLSVLRSYNARVLTHPDLDKERKDLLAALESRCQLIDEVEKGYQVQTLLDQQYFVLHAALRAYRPELEFFQDQDAFNQLIVAIANQGIAVPDLDNEVRDRAIETVFREFRSRIYLGAGHAARWARLETEIERARLQEDDTAVQDLVCERKHLFKESCNEASERVRTALKIARKRMCDKVLEELQNLTEEQAAQQKWAACSLARTSASALAQDCIEKRDAMDEVLQDRALEIDNALSIATDRLHKMNRLSSDNSSLVAKLAGLDVPRAERQAVLDRRRNDRRTPYIMMEVADQSFQLPGMSQRVLEQMDGMSNSLYCVLDAAKANLDAHDTLLLRVDEDDLYFMDETSHVDSAQGVVSGDTDQIVKARSERDDERIACVDS